MPTSEPAARSYLDHAACAPVCPEVAAQITRDLARATAGRANPAALHASGRRAGAALCEARARLAAALGVDPHEVLFTSFHYPHTALDSGTYNHSKNVLRRYEFFCRCQTTTDRKSVV